MAARAPRGPGLVRLRVVNNEKSPDARSSGARAPARRRRTGRAPRGRVGRGARQEAAGRREEQVSSERNSVPSRRAAPAGLSPDRTAPREGRNPPWRGRSALSLSAPPTIAGCPSRPSERAGRGEPHESAPPETDVHGSREMTSGRLEGSAPPPRRQTPGGSPPRRSNERDTNPITSTSGRARGPAGFKHITKRRKRN